MSGYAADACVMVSVQRNPVAMTSWLPPSAAAATRYWAGQGAPARWQVTVPGGVVGVTFFDGPGGREHVLLSGPAVLVADGVLRPAG